MGSAFQAYIVKNLGRLFLSFIALMSCAFTAGCATVSAVTSNIITDKYGQGNYEEYIKETQQNYNPSSQYLKPEVRRNIVNDSISSIKKGGVETPSMIMLRKTYLKFAHALIEIGDFKDAWRICEEGIGFALIYGKARDQHYQKNVSDRISEHIASKWIFNTSISPEDDNDTYIRRMLLYKAYIIWFNAGNKQASFNIFESILKDVKLTGEDAPFLLMDRGYYYMTMGQYVESLKEFNMAAAAIPKLHVLNTDMKQVYTELTYGKIADLNIKLGNLNEAEEALLKSEELQTGTMYKIGKYVSSFQGIQAAASASKVGAVYAIMKEDVKSKKYFDEALNTVKKIDSSSKNFKELKVLGIYNVNYGVFYEGLLKGNYYSAVDYVDKGIPYFKGYYLESVQEEPNILTANVYSSELHYIIGKIEQDKGKKDVAQKHFNDAIGRANNAINYAEKYRNMAANAAGHTLLGQIYYEMKDDSQAKKEYETALSMVRNEPNTDKWKLYYGIGQVFERQGREDEALKNYYSAIKEVELLWSGRFKDAQKQARFIDDRLVVYEPVIRILAKQGDANKAIGYMESSKSRTFYESSIYYSRNDGSSSLNEEDAKKVEALRENIRKVSGNIGDLSKKKNEVEIALGKEEGSASSRGVGGVRKGKSENKSSKTVNKINSTDKNRLEKELKSYKDEIKKQENDLNKLNKEENNITSKVVSQKEVMNNLYPLDGDGIRKILQANSPNGAILEYYVGDQLVVGAIITSRGYDIKILSITPDVLKDNIYKVRNGINIGNLEEGMSLDEYKKYSLFLYAALVKPFEKQLQGINNIGIISHGVLHYLPFQALIIRDESEKGISANLINREKEIMATAACASGPVFRGIKGVRKNVETKAAGEKLEAVPRNNCGLLLATRGVKGVRENKGSDSKNVKISDSLDLRKELEGVRSEIETERKQKGILDRRPEFMVDRFAIYYSPSSTILKYVQTKNALKAKNLLALGSPPDADIKDLRVAGREVLEKLLYAKTEVQEVGNFFPEKERAVFTDEAATETAAKNYSSSFDLLLFSTHGMLNRADPLKSMIILNKDSVNTDGRLTVSEIENIKFNANLVVLSACETGLISGYGGVSEDIKDAKFPHGDDLVGMQRVFMKSGSASVMSTLWEVDDDSTSTMVIDFFRRYKNGSNKASALREAELMIIEKNPLWEHPYFWAPFVLSGDWR